MMGTTYMTKEEIGQRLRVVMCERGYPSYANGRRITEWMRERYPDLGLISNTALASLVGRHVKDAGYVKYARTHGGATYRREKVILPTESNLGCGEGLTFPLTSIDT